MTKALIKQSTAAAFLLSLSTPGFAHTGEHGVYDFVSGFTHPWLGVDHTLVMLALGICAARWGAQLRWQLLLGFMLCMALGATAAGAGVQLPSAEFGVALSVVFMGVLLHRHTLKFTHSSMLLIALFALLHGFVHVSDAALPENLVQYTFGFLTATALLQALGFGLAFLGGKYLCSSMAWLCSCVGVLLLTGISL